MQHPLHESLFRFSPNAYLLLDPELVIVDANQAWLALTGYSAEALVGRPLGDVCADALGRPGLARELLASLERVRERRATDTVPALEDCRDRAVPEARCWSVTHTPILDGAGRVEAILQHLVDVSALPHDSGPEFAGYHQRLEEMVRARTRQLERSEAERRTAEAALFQAQKLEAVGKLTGGVAHAFNNMLQVIGGNLQLLRRNLQADPTASRRLEAAVGSVERGARLASQLLAFASRQSLQPQAVRLDELIERMFELLSGSLGRGIQVELEVEDEPWPVLADVGNLESVVLNLAANASDAMGGQGRLLLRVGNRSLRGDEAGHGATGDHVLFSVIDEGCGMSEEVRARAFEPFFTTKRGDSASGLGLSMVYGFVKQSGGFIDLEPLAQGGTAVRVYFPRCAAEEGAAAPAAGEATEISGAPVPEPGADGGAEAGGLRILFIEDDPTLRMLTGEVMTELGHDVCEGESAEEALRLLEGGTFDVLFTDIGLPGMNGLDLARQVRSRYPQLGVVIASGYAIDAAAEGLGDAQVVLKPYDLERIKTLLDAIRITRPAAGR